MILSPRVVLVHRRTDYEELIARHGTHGQAEFFLAARGHDLRETAERHERSRAALAEATAAVPLNWRQARVERTDLDRFLFGPEDVVVVVGQDGLVANAAKYLTGQPVIGVDTDPGRNPGVLVRHRAAQVARLLRATAADGARGEERTMVEAVTDDAQRLLALNEIYVGRPDHQTSRYRLGADSDSDAPEAQASSGLVVGTGTGATGWLRSLWLTSRASLALPTPVDPALAWFVREAWPSPVTGTARVSGTLTSDARLRLTAESERLVAFGDGMESDALEVTYGQTIWIGVADTRLRLAG
ncbi:hypothetical protein [Streptomyces sp. NPDC059816]|uniref:hypothetical protein n=1 Tax=Streptomyces sp. NPDC059816 TaxID=3346960 RepID=UPI0036573A16